MPIRIALIGSGIQSREKLLPAIKNCPNIQLKAIYSRTLKSAQKLGGGIPGIILASNEGNESEKGDGTNNLSSLILSKEIDAVIVALPIDVQLKPIAALTQDPALGILLANYQLHGTTSALGQWSIAENYRFLASFQFAVEQIKTMGKLMSFRTRMHKMVSEGEKLYETEWRKTPKYQGGFLLDGGVHFIAGTRLLLGPHHEPVKVSAFTSQIQKHLPPVDTVDAIWRLKSGVSGTFSVSFGTTFEGDEYNVSCEKGTVSISKGIVTVKPLPDSGIEAIKAKDMWKGPGVQEEVDVWASGLESGILDKRLNPKEALMDLKILEAMLRSGENEGVPVDVAAI